MRYAKTFGLVYAALAAAIFAYSPPVHATGYMKIGDVKGESQDDHSAGDEHEVEYDVAAGASATGQPDEVAARDSQASRPSRKPKPQSRN
ncbi:hypothetical protein [Hyphococcus sp.]|uniref:hypothetical protein n=1 Tax=Hyphococcus sp. TaxID=2038636 RepID=UPI003D1525E9